MLEIPVSSITIINGKLKKRVRAFMGFNERRTRHYSLTPSFCLAGDGEDNDLAFDDLTPFNLAQVKDTGVTVSEILKRSQKEQEEIVESIAECLLARLPVAVTIVLNKESEGEIRVLEIKVVFQGKRAPITCNTLKMPGEQDQAYCCKELFLR